MASILPIINNIIDWGFSIGIWVESHSALINATAAVAIACFTLALYWATKKLWQIARDQSNDMRTSLIIAQEAADAAKKSADALPKMERAYIFVKVTMDNPDREGIAGTIDETPQYNMDNVKFIITNHGKTPAIITCIPHSAEVIDNIAIDNRLSQYISDYDESIIPIGQTIIGSKEERPINVGFLMDSDKWHQITVEEAFLTCLGCIHYKDIFGDYHKTVFCWKYMQFTGFHPDQDQERNYCT